IQRLDMAAAIRWQEAAGDRVVPAGVQHDRAAGRVVRLVGDVSIVGCARSQRQPGWLSFYDHSSKVLSVTSRDEICTIGSPIPGYVPCPTKYSPSTSGALLCGRK